LRVDVTVDTAAKREQGKTQAQTFIRTFEQARKKKGKDIFPTAQSLV
jgi:hypothetical protein